MTKPYLDAPLPHRLAHRGATMAGQFDENSWDAFRAALSLGASHLETDAQVTSDGHAVLVHDDDLVRVGATPLTGGRIRVAEYSLAELEAMRLAKGGAIPSLLATLLEFPDARFNIDVKVAGAIAPVARAIKESAAEDRALITSFSDSRRLATLKLLAPAKVATSPGSAILLRAWLGFWAAAAFGRGSQLKVLRRVLADVDAIQVPQRHGVIHFANAGFIAAVRELGIHVHFWVINDDLTAKNLLALGATGLVSDDLPALHL